jgi:hypothetical protein
MERSLVHFVLTRLILDLGGILEPGDVWLRKRVEWFQTFTWPRLQSQSTLTMRWLIYYCDDGNGSCQWFRRWMDQALAAFAEVIRTCPSICDLDDPEASVTKRIPPGVR